MHRLTQTIILTIIIMSTQIFSDEDKAEKFYKATPNNPQIQAMVDAVSADSIELYIDKLVSFHTRHTNSDTVSADTGIGAARRWVYSKFQQTANTTPLSPEYFWFIESVCGINGLHANVQATLPGSLTPDRFFLVSGHMDSRNAAQCDPVVFAPGANDDASGSVISIELARIMSQQSYDASLIFMAVTGEDIGLVGSTAYANWAGAGGMNIDGMLTNDVVGNIIGPNGTVDSTSVRHFSEGPSNSPSRQLSRYFKLKGEQYVPEMTVNLIPAQDRPGRGGDHMPFNDNGYAAVRFTEPAERLEHQHSNTDILENMSPAYTARVAKLSLAGLANMAQAPETPTAPLTVQDVGSGSELLLSWTTTNNEPDFAGYRVAWRHSDSLFYERIDSVGNSTSYTLGGLTPNVPIFISYSAYDDAGHESIFSAEIMATPNDLPAAPAELSATSFTDQVTFDWAPNNELDLSHYLLTRAAPDGSSQSFQVDISQTSFSDNTLQAGTLYDYSLQAVDIDGNKSSPSVSVTGRLVSHDQGILVLDMSRDGPGTTLFPTDEAIDAFYAEKLTDFPVTAQWDLADSLQADVHISDAHLGAYSTVFLHSDVRIPGNFIADDTVAIKKYLRQGGRLLISGWNLIFSATRNGLETKTFAPGEFSHDFLQARIVKFSGESDFAGAFSQLAEYPDIQVDSVKTAQLNGSLMTMEGYFELVDNPATEVLYTYQSSLDPPSQFEGLPVAIRHIADSLKIVQINIPLFYMENESGSEVLRQALLDLGEVTGISENNEPNSEAFAGYSLSANYPNPFNPQTTISFQIPNKQYVRLTVFDMLGREVQVLVNEEKSAGIHSIQFDGNGMSSGIYVYRIEAGQYRQSRKMLLMK